MRRVAAILSILIAVSAPTSRALEFAGGTGEPNDPYRIATAEQLISIGSDTNLLSKHFVLIRDIDLDPNLPGGRVFDRAIIAPDVNLITPGYQGTHFRGVLDGDSHKVTGLVIRGGYAASCIGLFGGIDGRGKVHDLIVEGAEVSAGDASFGVGILAGRIYGPVNNCRVHGVVTAGMKSTAVGGFTGDNVGALTDCHAVGLVLGGYESRYVGGLDGRNRSSINRCSADCVVEAEGYSRCLGGLSGINTGFVSQCRAAGSVSGYDSVGGLVGENHEKLLDCCSVSFVAGYLQTGGLVGNLVAGGTMPFSQTGTIVVSAEAIRPPLVPVRKSRGAIRAAMRPVRSRVMWLGDWWVAH